MDDIPIRNWRRYEVIPPTLFTDRVCSPFEDRFEGGIVLPYHQVQILPDDSVSHHRVAQYTCFVFGGIEGE
jgi:hypothetical protein